ncbi:MAG: bifunctional adenosylcobinamide kinase/adenosylcobinamide-phosphate guanylyltransferase [Halofilum sp. (in: g-proteobacteria)]
MRELILGGARSGKSALAEARAEAAPGEVVYIATAEAADDEMAARIEAHRARRPDGWRTVEAPQALSAALLEAAAPGRLVIVDCLTLWLSNRLGAGADIAADQATLLAALKDASGELVLVSNEVGQGIVPDNAMARRFRDAAGRLNQAAAAACEQVTYVVAGQPLTLKTPSA